MLKAAGESSSDSVFAQQLGRLAAHYLVGFGHVNLRTGRVSLAEEAYREAIALNADSADPYNCLGTIALVAERPIEAETLYRRAREIEPQSPLYTNNLGRSLLSQVRLGEAVELFQRAIEIDPTFNDARTCLEERILPWLHYRSDLKPSAVFAAHRDWGRKEKERAVANTGASVYYANSRDPDRPLRIAYIGVDASSRLTRSCFEPLITNHDIHQFSAVVYATSGDDVADLRHLKGLTREFEMLRVQPGQEIAKSLRNKAIDIVIDVAGHMPHNRLDVLAHKPAPVAVTWLGYPATTGLSEVDFRITDEILDPRGAEEFHTERLYRLSRGSIVYRPPEKTPDVAVLPATKAGAVTFGNFDDPRKISPETAQTWTSILRALPESRLLLMAPEFADAAFAERIRSDFVRAGIASTRIEIRCKPADEHQKLRAHAEVDVALDTFPCNGAYTTICEALWTGAPVTTLSGDLSWGRTSASLLAQVGLERLDSHSTEEYTETAVELAMDLERLRTLRTSMRERMRVSPLMDERGFARQFEAALREMWRGWCKAVT
jgi:predicted O-linked N-acetylglucosamine transferase (SPINDLY family)